MGLEIKIAAANSTPEDKSLADVVCTGLHDERVINEQIAKLYKGGTIRFFDGDYSIDGFDNEENTAIHFGYNDGQARAISLVGDTENKGYNTKCGVCFHVSESAVKACREGESYRVFCGTAKRPDAPGDFFTMTYVNNVNFKNFYLYFYDASKSIIGIDCTRFGSSEITQVGVFTERFFEDRFLHLKLATPAVGCIGIRTCNHSNDEMARAGIDTADMGGLYIGYDFYGADHMILRNCTAARCCYGFCFSQSYKTITLINCADEGNTHLPRFKDRGQITMIDFAIERFDADFIPDDPKGDTEPYATEAIPGAWHGLVDYTLQGNAFGITHFWKKGHGKNFKTVNLLTDRTKRPPHPEYLETYFDAATNKTLTYNGEIWVDAMGNEMP